MNRLPFTSPSQLAQSTTYSCLPLANHSALRTRLRRTAMMCLAALAAAVSLGTGRQAFAQAFLSSFKYAYVDAIALQPDGKILVGGSLQHISGTGPTNFIRLLPDGSVDQSFAPQGVKFLHTIALQDDSKILTAAAGGRYYEVLRFTPSGLLDPSFQIITQRVDTVLLQPDGHFLTQTDWSDRSTNVFRWQTNGAPAPLATNEVGAKAISLQADGTFIAYSSPSVFQSAVLSGYSADGNLLWRTNMPGRTIVEDMLPQGDKTLLFGRLSLAGRLLPGGTLDQQFTPLKAESTSASLQSDGRMIISGYLNLSTGQPSGRTVFRANSDGTVDETFTSPIHRALYGLAIEPDGSILYFASQGELHHLVRLPNPTPAFDVLEFTGDDVAWTRGGSAPLAQRVTFLRSTDGTNWNVAGTDVQGSNGWAMAGLGLQPGEELKARAYVQNLGYGGASQWYLEALGRPGAPIIARHPAHRTNYIGTPVGFGVSAAGSGPMSFQWLKDGAPIVGATTPGLALPNAAANDAGLYELVISNSFGSVTSSPARLHLISEPVILVQPLNVVPLLGSTLTMNVRAAGAGPLSYQWQFEGTNLPGATAASLVITNVSITNRGNYLVKVSNPLGEVVSQQAFVRVPFVPTLTTRTLPGPVGLFNLVVTHDPADQVAVEASTDLINWSGAGGSKSTPSPGVTVYWVPIAGQGERRFFRAIAQ